MCTCVVVYNVNMGRPVYVYDCVRVYPCRYAYAACVCIIYPCTAQARYRWCQIALCELYLLVFKCAIFCLPVHLHLFSVTSFEVGLISAACVSVWKLSQNALPAFPFNVQQSTMTFYVYMSGTTFSASLFIRTHVTLL